MQRPRLIPYHEEPWPTTDWKVHSYGLIHADGTGQVEVYWKQPGFRASLQLYTSRDNQGPERLSSLVTAPIRLGRDEDDGLVTEHYFADCPGLNYWLRRWLTHPPQLDKLADYLLALQPPLPEEIAVVLQHTDWLREAKEWRL